jgi:3-oxoacid CoA-transferase subunit A
MATAARMVIAQVEELVEPGDLNPDHIITPGIFVKRMIRLDGLDKRIEQRTTRPRTAA